MNKTVYIFLISYLFSSCSNNIDYSNPKSVVEEFYKQKETSKIEKEYELIADTCKEYANFQDYKDYYNARDNNKSKFHYSILSIYQLPLNPFLTKYRRFEITYMYINKESNTSEIIIAYETVFNENGKWKIIWTKNLIDAAEKLIESEKIDEGMEIYNELLKYDPLNGYAYYHIGWTQFRQGYYELALENSKKAIELNPNKDINYNLLASIYSAQENKELAIENYKKAIEMTLSDKDKVYLYSNLSMTYIDMFEYNEAHVYINKALKIDTSDTHVWWAKGKLHENENNIDSAIICLKKATTFEPMNNYLQSQLYYSLSNMEFIQAKRILDKNPQKDYLLIDAKKQILKALDINPDDEQYKELLNDIKNSTK